MELSALRSLKLGYLSSLDPCRFLVFKQLTELEVGQVLDESSSPESFDHNFLAVVSNSMFEQVSNYYLVEQEGFMEHSMRALTHPALLYLDIPIS